MRPGDGPGRAQLPPRQGADRASGGHHHPGPTDAPLRDAGVRGQELSAQGGRRSHRPQPRIAIITRSYHGGVWVAISEGN
ncbi:MAG: hypothetical protein WA917_15355 [Comamonas sp.]